MAVADHGIAPDHRVLVARNAFVAFALAAALLTLATWYLGDAELHLMSDRIPWFELMHGATMLGDGAFALVVVVWLAMKRIPKGVWLVFVFGFALAALLPQLIKLAWPDALRPYGVLEGIHRSPLLQPAYRHSFPSGHSSVGAYFALFLAFRKPKWLWVYLSLGVLVGLSRIALHYHWTHDVVAGWAIGLCAAWVAERTLAHKLKIYGTT